MTAALASTHQPDELKLLPPVPDSDDDDLDEGTALSPAVETNVEGSAADRKVKDAAQPELFAGISKEMPASPAYEEITTEAVPSALAVGSSGEVSAFIGRKIIELSTLLPEQPAPSPVGNTGALPSSENEHQQETKDRKDSDQTFRWQPAAAGAKTPNKQKVADIPAGSVKGSAPAGSVKESDEKELTDKLVKYLQSDPSALEKRKSLLLECAKQGKPLPGQSLVLTVEAVEDAIRRADVLAMPKPKVALEDEELVKQRLVAYLRADISIDPVQLEKKKSLLRDTVKQGKKFGQGVLRLETVEAAIREVESLGAVISGTGAVAEQVIAKPVVSHLTAQAGQREAGYMPSQSRGRDTDDKRDSDRAENSWNNSSSSWWNSWSWSESDATSNWNSDDKWQSFERRRHELDNGGSSWEGDAEPRPVGMQGQSRDARRSAQSTVAVALAAAKAAAASTAGASGRKPAAASGESISSQVEGGRPEDVEKLLSYLRQATDLKKAMTVLRSGKTGLPQEAAEAAIARFSAEAVSK